MLFDKGRAIFKAVAMFGVLAACGGEPGEEPSAEVASELVAVSDDALIAKALMITDPSVVDAPPAQSRLDNASATGSGVWSFAHVMQSMAGSQDPSVFAEAFIRQLTTPQTVNGFVTRPVPGFNQAGAVEIDAALGRWCRTSTGKLDLTKAPFRLQAIVNRLDLRQSSSSAGELRFIFNLLATDDTCKTTGADDAILPKVTGTAGFNVIFEFSQRGGSCSATRSLAGKWRSAATLPFGTDYNNALATLTQRTLGYRDSTRPNRSLINQVRTNEPTSPSMWTFRELRLGGTAPTLSNTNPLLMASPAAVIDESVNGSSELSAFAKANRIPFRSGNLGSSLVPSTFLGKPFAAAESRNIVPVFVSGGLPAPDLAFQTCGGCHFARATGAHVGVRSGLALLGRELGESAGLSTFVTGAEAGDGEMPRRVALFKALVASGSCSTLEAGNAASSQRPSALSPGEPLYANWIMAPDPLALDTLRVYRASDPDSAAPLQSVTLASTAALTTSVLAAPTTAGTYDVRLFRNGTVTARSRPLTVELNVDYQLSHGSFVGKGELLPVFFFAPDGHSKNDRVALFKSGAPNTSPLASVATGAGTPTSTMQLVGLVNLRAPAVAGTYEVRSFRGGAQIQTAVGTTVTVF